MAIITEIVTINGRQFLHTYSDNGMMIIRDGVEYEEAYDPIATGRTYAETIHVIPSYVEDIQAMYEDLQERYNIEKAKADKLDRIKSRIETLRDEALLPSTQAIYQAILDLFEDSRWSNGN